MRLKSTPAALGLALCLAGCATLSSYPPQMPKSRGYQQLNAQLRSELDTGQARIEQQQHLVRLTLPGTVLFAEGDAQLNAAGQSALARVAPALKDLGGERIVVKGFTDDLPPGPGPVRRTSGNVELSKARADAVASYLSGQGVSAGLVSTVGLGETHPLASNGTPVGRNRNQRVEIDIVEAPR